VHILQGADIWLGQHFQLLTPLASGLHVPLELRQSGLFLKDCFDLRCILTGF
jgi:hypothetical protein